MVETEDPPRVFRSVSQVKEYDPARGGCPYRYYLHRVRKVWQKPAAWFPQGLAVHEAAEAWEKSGRTMPLEQVIEVCIDSYAEHTNRLSAETPNFDYWFRSGPYRGEADIERRFGIALDQTRKYIEYYTEKKPKEVIYQADGELAIEFPFEFQLGDVWIRGYVDAVVWDPVKKRWIVRDLKTGRMSGDELQLGTYGLAAKHRYGIDVLAGDYWMARTGKPTIEYDLTEWDEAYLTDVFGEVDEKIRAEEFEPAPDPDKCRFCSVNSACEYRASESF